MTGRRNKRFFGLGRRREASLRTSPADTERGNADDVGTLTSLLSRCRRTREHERDERVSLLARCRRRNNRE